MKYGLELFALIASALTFMGGLVMWYAGAVKKSYAAQRDFDHLKGSYKQIAANLDAVSREQDGRFDQLALELKEVKGLLTAIIVKITPGESSTGWYRKTRDEG